jgi:hypothetical protein
VSARQRGPKIAVVPKAKKRPSTGGIDPDALADGSLSWRMSFVDFDGTWGWQALKPTDAQRLHRALLDYERQPLRTLRSQKRICPIPVSDICEEAQKRLEALGRDDVEELWELRLGVEKWRTWGTLVDLGYSFLWSDPDHTVCRGRPRGKRGC